MKLPRLALLLSLSLIMPLLPGGSVPADATPAGADSHGIVLENIEVRGNTRTSPEVVRRYVGLEPGTRLEPDDLLDAVARLRDAEIFRSVEPRTERGRRRGSIRLILDVAEKGPEFRFGTGYRDLDGWYVIPAQLRWDNRLGRGEWSRLSVKLGYRIAGVEYAFDENRFGAGGRGFWGVSFAGYGMQRRYFLDGVEYRHSVDRGGLGVHVGRRIASAWSVEVGARLETVNADSTAEAAEDDEVRGIEKGDDLPFDRLPGAIAASVGERRGQIYHAQLSFDARSPRRIASTPVSGAWGRVRTEGLLREGADALAVTLDVRAYRALLGGAIAMRGRAGVIGSHTAFYDRFHLGGLYTVRGFPSQALSPAEGDTRFACASLEYRGPILGRPDRPAVMGVLFGDVGKGWTKGTGVDREIRGSAGFGFRVRVPWFDSVGFDFAAPIGHTPVAESFHAHGALGWNF